MKRALWLPTLLLTLACPSPERVLPPQALELRDTGLAQLENEAPEQAEETFRQLLEVAPEDPLGYANLGIALLRQQKLEEAEAALENALAKAPGRGDLLALRGDILQWSGRQDEALEAYQRAADANPQDPEVQYSLYRQATTLVSEEAKQAAARTAVRLAQLRPENVVVLLAQGQQAIASGDRAAASGAYLRVRELLWQAPPIAETAIEKVFEALEAGDLSAARTPALRLENVLKVSAMFRESLRELSTGIQGLPVLRFALEPEPLSFGEPVPVSFQGTSLSSQPNSGKALAVGDLNGDRKPDIARVVGTGEGALVLHLTSPEHDATQSEPIRLPANSALQGLLITDLDNDGLSDLLGYGPEDLTYWQGDGSGSFIDHTESLGLAGLGATAAIGIDFDIEGDLDLALAGGKAGAIELLFNNLQGPLKAVGEQAFPAFQAKAVNDLLTSDLDRDGDLDLLLAYDSGLQWFDNLRQGQFALRGTVADFAGIEATTAVVSADLDQDGFPEIITGGPSLRGLLNRQGALHPKEENGQEHFVPLAALDSAASELRSITDLVAFDADNDGRLDLAIASEEGIAILWQRPGGQWEPTALAESPVDITTLSVADLDSDGDLDLLTAGPTGLSWFTNQGGNANGWLQVRLRGLDQGNSKNNLLGQGATVEVRSGAAYQFRELSGDLAHFGLGQLRQADLLRVVWTNGVPQNRLEVAGDQLVVEEQVLKGSCPFLYVWNGEEMAFVTDLLWGAPLGMPVAPGVWAGADPQEIVRVDGAVPRNGRYEMRITEELWEAAYFDLARLWIVDHPKQVEVASSLRIELGQQIEDKVLASRDLKALHRAWDAEGQEVTNQVASRDEIYADGYQPSRYQGVAQRPWTFTMDLGQAPARSVRLHLDGWIFPADASLNLALAQRTDLTWQPPRLEVETAAGWSVLMPSTGFPAGKTKTMVVETPPLPPGAHRLRFVTTQWLSWDRIAWTTQPADSEALLRGKLQAEQAELRFRGFSRVTRQAPNGPHHFDYSQVRKDSPWLPMVGSYTRLGDVRELLRVADDRSVVLAAGDEIVLTFDASTMPPVAEGWQRTVFLESLGWDKDADRNTFEARTVEPLPFRAMSGYPFGEGESFPRSPELDAYRQEWLTRRID
ncbi:MAG: FG-GAP-like repeat-containing protein [Deltaproteobacteria bacterium]|nr:FG-GAP-like repeat-containing protein [Deltaproteobacteria bacterium]